jgi:hypothetical protein
MDLRIPLLMTNSIIITAAGIKTGSKMVEREPLLISSGILKSIKISDKESYS